MLRRKRAADLTRRRRQTRVQETRDNRLFPRQPVTLSLLLGGLFQYTT